MLHVGQNVDDISSDEKLKELNPHWNELGSIRATKNSQSQHVSKAFLCSDLESSKTRISSSPVTLLILLSFL